MNKPVISVIIPIYNGESFIKETLTSLKNQTFKNIEIICVNDFSTDKSIEIIENYAQEDKRFKLINRTIKGGQAGTGFVKGLQFAEGDFVFYMSQDDLIDDDFFEKAIEKLNTTGADVVTGNMIWYYGDKTDKSLENGIFPPNNNYELILSGTDAFELAVFCKFNCFYVFKRELAEQIPTPTLYIDGTDYAARKRLLYVSKVAFFDSNFYYRQNNPCAITKGFKFFHIQRILTENKILRLMIEHRIKWSVKNKYLKSNISVYKNLRKNYLKYKQLFNEDEIIKSEQYFFQARRELIRNILNVNWLYFFKLLYLKLIKLF